MVSVFESQREKPDGFNPEPSPAYDPDPSFQGPPDRIDEPGRLVARVNFLPEKDVSSNPEGWLAETGQKFGMHYGQTYGWDGPVKAARLNRDSQFINDTNNTFGENDSQSWSMEEPPGRYRVVVGLGCSRYPASHAFNWNTPEADYKAIHHLTVNGKKIQDEDGHADNYDTYSIETMVGPDKKITISAGPEANRLRLRYVLIYERAGF